MARCRYLYNVPRTFTTIPTTSSSACLPVRDGVPVIPRIFVLTSLSPSHLHRTSPPRPNPTATAPGHLTLHSCHLSVTHSRERNRHHRMGRPSTKIFDRPP